MKILILLDREDELKESYDRCRVVFGDWILNKYAVIGYLKLFLSRKEQSVDYLISLLRFYLSVPYSSSVINLLAKYQFDNQLSIDYDTEVLPKIAELQNDKSYARTLLYFKVFLASFANPSSATPYHSAGHEFKNLILDLEPAKWKYKPLKLLRLFYFLMYKKLRRFEEFRFEEFKKNNPDYDEDGNGDSDDYEEPYSYKDFIDDVFDGDESYQWNID